MKLTVTPLAPLSEQLDQLTARLRTPITVEEDAALWQQAEHNDASMMPEWLPQELGIWLNYRIALVVRLLLGDVVQLSHLHVLGTIVAFDSLVEGTPQSAHIAH